MQFYATRNIEDDHGIEIYWDDAFIGRIDFSCTLDEIDCNDPCDSEDISNLEPGTFRYRCVYGRLAGGGNFIVEDTIRDASITIGATQCKVIEIN